MGRRILPVILIASLLFLNTAGALADVEATGKPSADGFTSEVASSWFEVLYDVVKAEKTTPPVASRIYGIAAVALYEGIVSGAQSNRSLVGQLNGLTSMPEAKNKKYHWPTVANTVLAYTIRGLFPIASQASLTAINNREQSFASRYRGETNNNVYERSFNYGLSVASEILFWASSDGIVNNSNC